MTVELVYDPGCPSVDGARAVLAGVLRDTGLPAVWAERSTGDPDCPERCRGFGSPTILVNGRDVAPGPHPWRTREEHQAPRCRLYENPDGSRSGVPPADRVRAALDAATGPHAG